eukprot:6205914-Pyramimonas_sp.AAC.2
MALRMHRSSGGYGGSQLEGGRLVGEGECQEGAELSVPAPPFARACPSSSSHHVSTAAPASLSPRTRADWSAKCPHPATLLQWLPIAPASKRVASPITSRSDVNV